MTHVRKRGRILSALLALLMVLSTVIALPAVAEESATTSENKTPLWEADLSTYGTVSGGTKVVSTLKDSLGLTGGNTGAKLENGFLMPIDSSTKMGATDSTNTFFNLLTGTFTVDSKALERTFVEFDYKFGSDNPTAGRKDDTTTVAGIGSLTATTDYGDYGGQNWNFRMSGNQFIFRVSSNNYLYTNDIDIDLKTVKTGIDGYIYYTDADYGKLYFDAKGYRYSTSAFTGYTVLMDGKYYLDDPDGTAPTVADMSLTSVLDPAKRDQAYRLKEDTIYRIGLDIRSSTDASSGKITIQHTVYIKEKTADAWEKCVGTSTQTWSSDSTAVTFTGSKGIYYGGNMVAYTYTCGNGQHLDGMCTTTRKFAEGGAEYYETSCLYCGFYEVTKDGVAYNSQTVQNGCGGSHTLWTATDNSGKVFKTDIVESNHDYDTAGKCTVCANYSWYAFPAKSDGTYITRNVDGKDYNGDGTISYPTYTVANGYVNAPDGNMIMRYLPEAYVLDPYVFSMDFYVDEALKNPLAESEDTTVWTLLSYRTGPGNINIWGDLLGLAVDTDGEGNATGNPYLTGALEKSRKLFELQYDTWYNIQVVCDPVSKYCALYVNGEYIDAHTEVVYSTSATSAAFVIGLVNYTGPYTFAYRAKNLALTPVTLDTLFGGADASNTLFTLRYDDGLEANSALQGLNRGVMGSYSGNLSTATEETVSLEGDYAILNTKSWYPQFAMSHTSGTDMFTLSDKKYELKLEFAVPDTDAYGEYTNGVQASGADDLIDALQYAHDNASQKGQHLVRLSKYDDDIQSVLVSYTNKGELTANDKPLYDRAGNAINITCAFVDGVPSFTTDLRVVVDENNNVYSVYVNGSPAYYQDGDVFKSYINMPMPLSKGNITDSAATSYGAITKEMAAAAGYTDTYHYCRIFRNMWGVAVKEISLSLIPDSNVELAGVQMRNSDNGAADRTFDLRFLFGLDDLYVHEAGYKIKAYENGVALENEAEESSNLVFEAVNVGTSRAFHAYETSKGDFLSAIKITGIEETVAESTYTFEIRPYTVATNSSDKTWSNVIYVVSCNGLGGNITVTSRAATE